MIRTMGGIAAGSTVFQNRPREKPKAAVGTMRGMFTKTSSSCESLLVRFFAMYSAMGMPVARSMAVTTEATTNDVTKASMKGFQSASEGVPVRTYVKMKNE